MDMIACVHKNKPSKMVRIVHPQKMNPLLFSIYVYSSCTIPFFSNLAQNDDAQVLALDIFNILHIHVVALCSIPFVLILCDWFGKSSVLG